MPEQAIPSERLPHSPPALLLTSAVVDRENSTARGVRAAVPASETGMPEHLEALPQMLLMEMMSQTAGLLLPSGTGGAVVAAINRMVLNSCPRRAVSVETQATLTRQMGELYIFDCKATAAGKVLAAGSIVLRAI